MIKSLSVFFPAYNEEENIVPAVEKAVKVLEGLELRWEVLIIDDGSKDRTGELSDELASKDKRIRVIHQKNGGYGLALRAGFYNSQYEWIFFTDADVQFDFSEVKLLMDKAVVEDLDLVIGYRIDRKDPPLRKLNGWGWTQLTDLMFGMNVRDVDCAFKLIKREVLEKIPKLESTRGAMISPELLAKAKKAGFKMGQIGVTHFPREYGNPTGAKLSVIFQSFLDLFKMWIKLR